MRDPKRIGPVLRTIERVWRDNPDLRLGQIIVNAARTVHEGECGHQIFNIEDYMLVAGLETLHPSQNRPASTREDEACI